MRASEHASMIAVCDVDDVHMDEFNAKFDNKLKMYHRLSRAARKGEAGHRHHRHARPLARADRHRRPAGRLRRVLRKAAHAHDRRRLPHPRRREGNRQVFQVGTQQRSEHGLLFLKAIAIVQSGRLGKKVNADIAIGGGMVGGPFPTVDVPDGLDWDMWVGPANKADYSPERRKEFRWFFDYSGGKMTDWGAHHIDIAQWALGPRQHWPGEDHARRATSSRRSCPTSSIGTPTSPARQAAQRLPHGHEVRLNLEYADGSIVTVHDKYMSQDGKTKFDNGILFEGEDGRIFVNRERLTGKPVEDMTDAERVDDAASR